MLTPGMRDLLDAVDDLGLGNPHRIEDRRDDVDEMVVLPALLALGLDAFGPVHDHPGPVPPPWANVMPRVAGVPPAMAQPTA